MYGLIITAGILVAAWFAEKQANYEKKDPSRIWGALLWILIFGLIGARLYHVADFWQFYSRYPAYIPQIWKGGLGILGGILGGLIGFWLFAIVKRMGIGEALSLLDIGALALPLGQFIGRFANYFNQELYGLPTNLPWAIYIQPEKRLESVVAFSTFHPLFLYESLGCLIIFAFLFIVKNKRCLGEASPKGGCGHLDGDILLLYLLTYGLLRFALEPLRIAHWEIAGIYVAQLISALFVLLSLGALSLRKR